MKEEKKEKRRMKVSEEGEVVLSSPVVLLCCCVSVKGEEERMFRQFSRPQQTRNPALIQTTQLLREKFSYVSPFSELENELYSILHLLDHGEEDEEILRAVVAHIKRLISKNEKLNRFVIFHHLFVNWHIYVKHVAHRETRSFSQDFSWRIQQLSTKCFVYLVTALFMKYIHAMPTETHLVVLDDLLGPTLGPRFLCLFEPILRSFLRADAADDASLILLDAKLVQCASDISDKSAQERITFDILEFITENQPTERVIDIYLELFHDLCKTKWQLTKSCSFPPYFTIRLERLLGLSAVTSSSSSNEKIQLLKIKVESFLKNEAANVRELDIPKDANSWDDLVHNKIQEDTEVLKNISKLHLSQSPPFPPPHPDLSQFLNTTLPPLLFSGIPGDPNSLLFRELSSYVTNLPNPAGPQQIFPDLVIIAKLIEEESEAQTLLLEKLLEYPQFLDLSLPVGKLQPTLIWWASVVEKHVDLTIAHNFYDRLFRTLSFAIQQGLMFSPPHASSSPATSPSTSIFATSLVHTCVKILVNLPLPTQNLIREQTYTAMNQLDSSPPHPFSLFFADKNITNELTVLFNKLVKGSTEDASFLSQASLLMFLSTNDTLLKIVQLAVENKGQASLLFSVLSLFAPENMVLPSGCNSVIFALTQIFEKLEREGKIGTDQHVENFVEFARLIVCGCKSESDVAISPITEAAKFVNWFILPNLDDDVTLNPPQTQALLLTIQMLVNQQPNMDFLHKSRPFTMLFGLCRLLNNSNEVSPASKDILAAVIDNITSFLCQHRDDFEDAFNLAYFQVAVFDWRIQQRVSNLFVKPLPAQKPFKRLPLPLSLEHILSEDTLDFNCSLGLLESMLEYVSLSEHNAFKLSSRIQEIYSKEIASVPLPLSLANDISTTGGVTDVKALTFLSSPEPVRTHLIFALANILPTATPSEFSNISYTFLPLLLMPPKTNQDRPTYAFLQIDHHPIYISFPKEEGTYTPEVECGIKSISLLVRVLVVVLYQAEVQRKSIDVGYFLKNLVLVFQKICAKNSNHYLLLGWTVLMTSKSFSLLHKEEQAHQLYILSLDMLDKLTKCTLPTGFLQSISTNLEVLPKSQLIETVLNKLQQ